MNKITKIIISIFLLATFLLSGCEIPTQPQTSDTKPIEITEELVPATQEMKKFENIEELSQFLLQRSLSTTTQSSYGRGMMKTTTGAVEMMESAPMMDFMADDGGSAQDFSQTNVQYEKVDEADFVKNDNQYIYMIADNKLIIVDAYDAENAEIISETKIKDYDEEEDYYRTPQAKELFINEDNLVLFVEDYDRAYYFEKYDIEPRSTYKQNTKVYLYDISDKSNPDLKEEFSLPGAYYQARMIKDNIYTVTREGVYRDQYYINEPVVRTGSDIIKPEIYYFDNPEENYQFNTITSIDISDEKVIDSKSFMLGYSNTLMVSEDNIFIAYQKQRHWSPWYYRQQYESERFYDVILPALKGEIKDDIKEIIKEDLSEKEEWEEISKVLSDFFIKIEDEEDLGDEYEDMFEELQDALEEYDMKKALEERKTVIHKIGIDDGEIDYKAKGEVDGSLLNQFSLDENEDYLRVATNVNVWAKKRIEYNNVYVLDKDMKLVGELENIAEDERIYSTRFMGDKLYMVTFKQVDPFFVIDLSNPEKPKILGKLKLPGFSQYLHPYNEDYIIGIGKETKENKWGGVSVQGVKIALFDVSDVNDPILVDEVEIGDRGSDSAVLHDHKAFLFSKSKDLLVLPVTKVTDREQINQYRYSNKIWYGAYVFKVTEDGFDEIGRVKHSSKSSDYWSWRRDSAVLRSLYMDDNLYTISKRYIKINDLGGELEELNSIKLPYNERDYYY